MSGLRKWRGRLSGTRDLLFNPQAEARIVLRQIHHRRRELIELIDLWDAYRRELTAALRKFETPENDAGEAQAK